ncbi:single-stranded DNA-binding protein [Companilactobacillus sp. DQM5]|uniref:single-stranded DNA-binding protein n=1 Tax=Companilactobacillus sp. DQM5 TaxID=3463359 RepID=UPI00405A25BA
MINRVVLVGRLTKDPDLRYTQSGSAVASFTLAVNRQFTNQQGEREADFINCVIWRKAAENFVNFTKKGSLVGIDGRLQSRSYENQQGQRVYVTEVVVDNFSLLEPKSSQKNDNASNQGFSGEPKVNQNQNTDIDTSRPYEEVNGIKPDSNPFNDNGHPVDISDEDLPF